jgi:hypothetical protein
MTKHETKSLSDGEVSHVRTDLSSNQEEFLSVFIPIAKRGMDEYHTNFNKELEVKSLNHKNEEN